MNILYHRWRAQRVVLALAVLAGCGGSTAASAGRDASSDATQDTSTYEAGLHGDGGPPMDASLDTEGAALDGDAGIDAHDAGFDAHPDGAAPDAGPDAFGQDASDDGGCGSISTGNGANCDQCAATYCCAPYEQCANDPGCVSYANCLNACAVEAGAGTPDSGPCFDGCGAAYPAGETELNAYEGCLFGPNCYYACISQGI